MLVSKLNIKAYPVADLKTWLTGDYENLDPVFAGRLAAMGRSKGVKVRITEGYRSPERQLALYNQYLNYLKTGRGSVKLAAKPGTSWHEYHLAIDTSTQPFRNMTNAQLRPYGLCKPISSEGWHIQPIETSGQTNRSKFAPEEVEDLTEADVRKIVAEILVGKDTKPSTWAVTERVAEKAKAAGVSDGTRPQGCCTREEAAAMILRAMKK